MGLPRGIRLHRAGEVVADLSALRGARVLVTGASGFIGSRLVERLVLEAHAQVRVLVRERVAAAPLARLPIEVAVGDVLRPDTLAAATADCAVVFNCVKGKSRLPKERRAVEVEGTRNVLEAAGRSRVPRAVHLSSVMVYDLPAEGIVDETSPRIRTRDAYASAKLASERIALELGARGEPGVTVIQPTVVYGPHAGVYGRDVIEELQTSRVPLINGGSGASNAVYIDDVVTALLLAATSDRARGEAFLIAGPEPVTWREFFDAFERMLGVEHTFSVSLEAAVARKRREGGRPWLLGELLRLFREEPDLRRRVFGTREGALALNVAHRLLPVSFWYRSDPWFVPPAAAAEELPVGGIRPFVARFLASRARVDSAKARRLLGYEPVFGFAAGMHLTEAWARWAGLLERDSEQIS